MISSWQKGYSQEEADQVAIALYIDNCIALQCMVYAVPCNTMSHHPNSISLHRLQVCNLDYNPS